MIDYNDEKIIRGNVHEILSSLYAKKIAKKITNGQAIVILEKALDEVTGCDDLSEAVEHNMTLCDYIDTMISADDKEKCCDTK